jgi:hypothetical protein
LSDRWRLDRRSSGGRRLQALDGGLQRLPEPIADAARSRPGY